MTADLELTPANPANLPAPDTGRVFYRDPKTRGLGLRVSASGERVFYLYVKAGGKPVRVALGPFDPSLPASRELTRGVDPLSLVGNRPSLNLRMARALALAVATELAKGNNPATVKRDARKARDGELTLAAAFDRYERDHLQAEAKRSADELRQLFERYLGTIGPGPRKKRGRARTKSPHGVDWSARKLSAIAPEDVKRLQLALREGHGVHTANRAFELLRATFRWVAREGLFAGTNPCEGLSKFREEARERFIQGDEAPRFFAAIDALPEGPFRDFLALALYTGARRTNLLGMRWTDLDLHAALWNIPAAASKNARPMTIPLTRRAVELLERRRAADPIGAYVFPAASASGHMTPPTKAWAALLDRIELDELVTRISAADGALERDGKESLERALARAREMADAMKIDRAGARLDDLRLHDLRRSVGSWAAMTGASLPIIGRALGHRSAGSTSIYARLQADPVREALQRAQDALLLAANKPAAEVTDIKSGKARRS